MAYSTRLMLAAGLIALTVMLYALTHGPAVPEPCGGEIVTGTVGSIPVRLCVHPAVAR